MAELKPWEIPQGTGMFNLMRQLGGSMGIAIVATLLSRFTTESKSVLTEHVGMIDPEVLGRVEGISRAMVARGMNPASAHAMAYRVIDRSVSAQASVLAFSRIYLLSGIVLCFAIPLMLFWKHGKGRAAVQAH